MGEKRKLARFGVTAPARMRVLQEGTLRDYQAQTRDVSAGGAFLILSDDEIAIGTRVALEIDVRIGAEPLPAVTRGPFVHLAGTGKVARHDDQGVAVAFDKTLKFATTA